MNTLASSPVTGKIPPQSTNLPDPATGAFLDGLRPLAALPLFFTYAERETRAGYHVTEVKTGRFAGLDCGANPEAWTETFIQVWDVPGASDDRTMTVGKFLAIMDKVSHDAGIDPASKLTFECGDDVRVIGLYAVSGITIEPRRVVVSLAPRQASCKPRDRWFEAQGVEKPVRLTEADAQTEKTMRATVSGCCSGAGVAVAQASKCC